MNYRVSIVKFNKNMLLILYDYSITFPI